MTVEKKKSFLDYLMCTKWIKYKEVRGSSVNGNLIYPYQNIVVKVLSLSLSWGLFYSKPDGHRKEAPEQECIWVLRSALQKESPAHRGKSCPSASWAEKAVDGRVSPLWSPLGTSRGAPASKLARLHPSRTLALPAVSQHSKAMGFLLERTSNMEKRKWQRTASTS